VRLVDVGAGTGIVSLTAAILGADVLALDHDAAALTRLLDAASRHDVHVATMQFDLYSDAPLPAGDVFVFSDLLYEPVLARAAAARVIEALAARARVIVADPGRVGRADFLRVIAASRSTPVAFSDVVVALPGEPGIAVGVLQW